MTVAIGAWLAEVYLLSTAVLLAACVAMRSLRQPSRRLFVARCAAVGVVVLIGVVTWSSRPGVAGRPTIPAGTVAPPPPSPTDPSTLRVAGLESPPANLLAIGCETPPPILGCPDVEESPPLLSAAGCEPVAPDGRTARPTSPGPTSGNPPGPRAVAGGVSLAFLIGCGMTAAWLLAGAMAAAGLLARTIEAPRELRAKLSNVVGGGGRVPRLRIGPGVGQPFAIGVLRPTIVLPARFACEGEPEGRVEAALRHEWAHIRITSANIILTNY